MFKIKMNDAITAEPAIAQLLQMEPPFAAALRLAFIAKSIAPRIEVYKLLHNSLVRKYGVETKIPDVTKNGELVDGLKVTDEHMETFVAQVTAALGEDIEIACSPMKAEIFTGMNVKGSLLVQCTSLFEQPE